MKKLVGVLTIVIVIMGIVSGILYYQLIETQNDNDGLTDQNIEIHNQLEEMLINSSKLENQIFDLENQIDELENQNSEL